MVAGYAGKVFRQGASVMGTRMTQIGRIKADGGTTESVPICLICVIRVPMKKRLPMSVSMPGRAKPDR